MNAIEVLKTRGTITLDWSNKTTIQAQRMCGAVEQFFPNEGVICFLERGYLMIYLVSKNATFKPCCPTADTIIENKISKSIIGRRNLQVKAPTREEIKTIERVTNRRIKVAF